MPSLTGPSSAGPAQLQVRGTTLLMAGHRGRLTAWLPDAGQLREVTAAWSTEGDAISLTSNGLVIANHPGGAKVRARYGEHEGVEMVHVVENVAGVWRGSITVVDCWPQNDAPAAACEGRVALVAPLVLNVTQSTTADNYDNLRATVQVFTPPASGSFIGATDSSGQLFLDGHVERPDGTFGAALKLRWMLEDSRLVPFTDNAMGPDMLDVLMTGRSPATLVGELWRLSSMAR